MKKLLLTLFAAGIMVYVYAQNNDTLDYRYSWYKDIISESGLQPIEKENNIAHLRLATELQTIEVWTNNYKDYYGSLINHTWTCNNYYRKKKKIPEKVYVNSVNLDALIAQNIFQALSNENLPYQDSVKAWPNGDDGVTYFFEFMLNGKYFFRTYWCPKSYSNKFPEAAEIAKIVTRIENNINMEKEFENFINSLPKVGCYKSGFLSQIKYAE